MSTIKVVLLILNYIIGIVKLQNGRWLCPKNCGRSYKEKFSLNRHFQKECGVEPQHQCLLCSKAFKRKESLKSHSHFIHKVIYTSADKKPNQVVRKNVPFSMN